MNSPRTIAGLTKSCPRLSHLQPNPPSGDRAALERGDAVIPAVVSTPTFPTCWICFPRALLATGRALLVSMTMRCGRVTPGRSEYGLSLGFGMGIEEGKESKKTGRLTGIGIGFSDNRTPRQIWRMDYHPAHGVKGDGNFAYIEHMPFHYHVERAPKNHNH